MSNDTPATGLPVTAPLPTRRRQHEHRRGRGRPADGLAARNVGSDRMSDGNAPDSAGSDIAADLAVASVETQVEVRA
jgi:hypothetical protein